MASKTAAKLRTIEPRELADAVSTVDQVMESVKSGIRQARYVPGQRLVEPDMMRDFDVSRGTVREALRRLAAEGFVQIELYSGAAHEQGRAQEAFGAGVAVGSRRDQPHLRAI